MVCFSINFEDHHLHIYICATDDDDFADFQAAPVSPPANNKPNLLEMLQSSAPQAQSYAATPSTGANNNLFGMLAPTSSPPAYQSQTQSSMFSTPIAAATPPPMRAPAAAPTPMRATSTPAVTSAPAKPSSNFDDLWSMSLGSSAVSKPAGGAGKSIKDLEKEKAQAGIWGSGQKTAAAPASGMGGGFGNFGGSFGGSSSTVGGDDLLL